MMRPMRLLPITLVVLLAAAPAHADALSNAEARTHFDSGNAAFALGDYAKAAQEYEKAFALKPDPALLYNAAQAHRVAGNKQRALLLYQNYLRVYGGEVNNADEVRHHIETLKKAIEEDTRAQTAPPTAPKPIGESATAPPPAVVPPPAAPPPSVTTPALTVTAPPPERPIYKKPWFWAVVGTSALVVAGVAIGLGVGLGGDKNPSATLGTVAGN
jgi:tetratricopeptide (TPR) repeat protein